MARVRVGREVELWHKLIERATEEIKTRRKAEHIEHHGIGAAKHGCRTIWNL